MNARRWAALIIAVSLFLVSIVYQVSVTGSSEQYENIFQDEFFEQKVIKEGSWNNRIAVLNLEGVIQDLGDTGFVAPVGYNHKQFLRMIEEAGKDPLIDGIILQVNSPGGGVVESAEIHDKIIEVKEKYDKPLYVSMGNMAASGGYYVSAPADKIVANAATLTGSIGVIMESINISELADNYGIDFNTIKSGEFKDIMSPSRPMTKQDKEILQTIIDEMYDEFVEVIANGRDMSIDRVKEIGDGRIYTGKQAQEIELVDELGNLEDTIAFMEEDYGLDDAQVVELEPTFGFKSFLGISAKNMFQSDVELHSMLDLLRQSDGPRAMYLYAE